MPIELTKQNVIDLTKKAEFQLNKLGLGDRKAKVIAVLDISLSMRNLYHDNTVQNIVSRVLGLAHPLDDDGELDIILFGNRAYQMPAVSIDEIEGYVRREILTKHPIGEGTSYAPPLELILSKVESKKKSFVSKLFGSKQEPDTTPTFVLFFTDGQNFDREATEKVIRQLSHTSVFVQFIGIGSEDFEFLDKRLNKLDGTFIDAAGFMKISDINNVNNSQLYADVLNEFPQWIDKAKNKGILSA